MVDSPRVSVLPAVTSTELVVCVSSMRSRLGLAGAESSSGYSSPKVTTLHVYIYTPGDMYCACTGSAAFYKLSCELMQTESTTHTHIHTPVLASLLWSVWIQRLVLILLTLGAHAQRGLQYLVCLSVCRRLFWHYRLRGGLLAIPVASELREPEKYRGDFLKRLHSRDML